MARLRKTAARSDWVRMRTTRAATAIGVCVLTILAGPSFHPAAAQQPGGWQLDLNLPPPAPEAPPADTTTVKPKTSAQDTGAAAGAGASNVRLVALLTADGQRIDQDLVWRIFEESKQPNVPGKLILTSRESSPTVRLAPGSYMINAAFGRAYITRKVDVAAAVETTEPFVLNAGGLRVAGVTSTGKIDNAQLHFDILTDERDQLGNRSVVISRARPGVVLRLNAGIYQIVSTFGDANAIVRSDVTVEAGKLTEATVTHGAARVTFKLVTRAGGEAVPDTTWTILTEDGQTVRQSVGALPSHVLAPGDYLVVARSQGQAFRRSFSVKDGDAVAVEVLRN